MKKRVMINILSFAFCIAGTPLPSYANGSPADHKKVIIVKMGINDQVISDEWKSALQARMIKKKIDSMGDIKRRLTAEEIQWKDLIVSKTLEWNSYRDSLAVPFQNVFLPDTIYVLLGFLGDDDGFTFGRQTICLDLTALFRVYGKAGLGENNYRINRIFSHEFTHLLHKEWARQKRYRPETFLDEILWECLYEGIGMYRSLNPRWLPVNDTLPSITRSALQELYPIFTERMITIKQNSSLSESEKKTLQANLSRGAVNEKWGALPVAIWLLFEARGDEKQLVKWIDQGPQAVIELARKYLPTEHKNNFAAVF